MFLFAEMDEMTTSDWVRLIGVPLVTFLLGLTSALLIWYFKRKNINHCLGVNFRGLVLYS